MLEVEPSKNERNQCKNERNRTYIELHALLCMVWAVERVLMGRGPNESHETEFSSKFLNS